MWLAFILVAIVGSGTVFMIRFLIALLREGAPSVCYWVIPSAAAASEEREQYDSDTDLEFGVRDLGWPHPATTPGRWHMVNPWERRTADWNPGKRSTRTSN